MKRIYRISPCMVKSFNLLQLIQFRSYNQHWLIQEAEQRRLAGGGGSTKNSNGISPSIAQQNSMNSQHSNGQHNMMMSSPPSSHGGEIQISPHIQPNSPVYENSSYVNHQQVDLYRFYWISNTRKFLHWYFVQIIILNFYQMWFIAQSSAEQHVYKPSKDNATNKRQ